ncbi:PilZ domain-containing protein [Novosphingobium aquiterrae]|uniref:PilZ domain-containing protein n=1 Tax=Novosphingobium aquiterrae TaxID=624388 RepID=A0ABV6PGG7_9SPHN
MKDAIGELSHSAERISERRADGRAATVFRPVLIETEEFAGFCLVRNISPNGLMGVVYTQFAEGLPVTIQFNQDLIVKSKIIWSSDGRVGVQFDVPINVAAVLDSLAKRKIEGKINRAPRVQVHCNGAFLIGDRTLSISLLDISQRGLKVLASFVRPGDEVLVKLDGLESRKAAVRWVQEGTVGMNFLRPLGFEELAEWVIRQQTDQANKDLNPNQSELVAYADSFPTKVLKRICPASES